jgi:polysaccharide chain length determinant protein (PEP-CTERM system associated)
MEEKSGPFQIDHYLELALKHRWFLILPFCLSMVIGIILIFVLPKIYGASTLILVRPQSVPTDFVQSIVTSDIKSRINTISQKILSRTNLEKIITQFNLFMEPEWEDMYIEDKVADLHGRIRIALKETETKISKRGREVAEMFSISFSGENPELVARVVNGLAALFIDENLRVREAAAVGTSTFLEDELQSVRRQLESVEQKLREFRKRHMGELPEELETNLRIMDRLQMQIDDRQESLRSAKNRLIIMESQIKDNKITNVPENTVTITDGSGTVLTLDQLKQQLAALQISYTERHPDVVRLKSKIADLEAKIESGEISPPQGGTIPLTGAGTRMDIFTAQLRNQEMQEQAKLDRARTGLKMEINNLNIDIRNLENEIGEYQRRVENTPKREQELQFLQRDYQNIQGSYNSLLNRKLEADIAVNMEKKQKGEQFQIIDRARVPLNPMSPNFKMIFILSVFLGLNFGGGLIFLKAYFDSSFKRSEDVEKDLGISVLATIPKIYQTKDFRKRMLRKVMTVSSLFIATCLFAGFAVLAFIGPETTMEMIRDIINSQTI